MKRKIEDALFSIGVPASYKGFRYIVDAVLILNMFPEYKMTDIYSKIGKIRNVTASSVERDIRHAFFVCRKGCNQKEINHYIGSDHTTNKDSIYHLYMIIKREVEDENGNY